MAYLITFLRGLSFRATLITAILLGCYILMFRKCYHPTDLGIPSKAGSRPSLFFLETSNKSNIEARVACSIESAALHHPDHDVIVHSIGVFSPTDPFVTVLRGLANIRFLPLNLNDQFKGTPFEEWHRLGLIQQSEWPFNQLSNALRLAILWKEGGVYLDTDVIVLRPLRGLRNAVALQNDLEANNAILFFDRSSRFLFQCMEDFIEEFRGDVWGHQSPQLITRNIKEFCNWWSLARALNERSVCKGVTLMSSNSFYPVSWESWRKLFEPDDDVDLSNSYAVHLWGRYSRDNVTVPGNKSLLEYLVRNNCPSVYELMKLNGTI